MPIGTQAKLLRVIEESKVRRLGGAKDIPITVRVLAATNRAPEDAVRNKLLREDLYYRLNVFHISLPPLRERKEDIPAIATAMIRSLNRKHDCRVTHLSPEVLGWFAAGSWPGNVRELRNHMERAVIMAREGEIQLRHLPPGAANGEGGAEPAACAGQPRPVASTSPENVLQFPIGTPMSEVEESYVRMTLRYTGNNKTRAAQLLGLSLRTLHNKALAYTKGSAMAAGQGETAD